MGDASNPKPAEREGVTSREIRAHLERPDGADAFLPDPQERGTPLPSDDAESFAEEFIATATTGEAVDEDARDEVVDEEEGGPFLELDTMEDLAESARDVPKTRHPGPRRVIP